LEIKARIITTQDRKNVWLPKLINFKACALFGRMKYEFENISDNVASTGKSCHGNKAGVCLFASRGEREGRRIIVALSFVAPGQIANSVQSRLRKS
jgi:hypothetical protein